MMDLGFLTSLNLIFYVILGFAVLAGFLRGFTKTLFTFITMAIFYIFFFVTIDQMVGILWNFNFSFLGNFLSGINPELSSFTSFANSYENVLQIFLGENININNVSAEFLDLAVGLLLFGLKIVWTILYFTVVLLFYKILCGLLRMIFIRNKEGASKNRLFGAIFGALNGAMAVFVLLIMLGGIMSFAGSAITLLSSTTDEPQNLNFVPRTEIYQANQSVLLAEGTEIDFDDIIADIQASIDEYENNIVVQLASSITTKSSIDENVEVPLHIDLFDRILSFEYNDQVIAFRFEMAIFSEAASIFLGSDFYKTEDITSITGDEIRGIFASLSNSKLVVSLLPLAIELGAERFDKTDLVDVEKLYDGSIDFEAELATIGVVAGAIFDILNGAGFIGGEGSVEQIEITGTKVREIFTDLSNSEVMIMLTETVLFPMLDEGEGNFSAILTIPADLDITAEYLALGEIIAEIVDANISFSDLADADVSVLLNAVSKIDLTILLDSRLVTNALINILSGTAEIEGFDMLSIPANIDWEDIGENPGELRLILEALNAFIDVVGDIDFENLSIDILVDMDDDTIDTFFASYVLRATVSDLINSLELGTTPLVFPDSVFDLQGYFTENELKALVRSVKLIIDDSQLEVEFDVLKVLNLNDTEVETLLTSDIIFATIGDLIYDMGDSQLNIPNDAITTVLVDSVAISIISKVELKSIFKALSLLEITDFDTVSFDAGIINKLENSTQDDLDNAKVNQLLDSLIIHATVSEMVIDLDKSKGGMLVIPDNSVDSLAIINVSGGIDYLVKTEIFNLLRALYLIDITDFNNIDFEKTDLLLDNFDDLMDSAIIHATVSDIILSIGAAVVVPDKDILNQDVLVIQGSVSYIKVSELNALLDGLKLLGVTNPSTFSEFTFANLGTDTLRTQLLESAILHATISDQMLSLGQALLLVPQQAEDGTDLIVNRGVLNPVDYVIKNEIKAIIEAMIAMGYSDVMNLSQEINAQAFIDNVSLVLASSSMQATVSNIILTSASGALIVPDEDAIGNDLRIVYPDVTYIKANELEKLFDSIGMLNIVNLDFSTFQADLDVLDTLNLNDFFASYIMQATVSDSFLSSADDELAAVGTTKLLVPSTKREAITVESVASTIIEKTELVNLINAFITLDLGDYADSLSANFFNTLTETQVDTLLDSDSMHVTIDNMLRANAYITTSIPNLVEDSLTYTITITVKSEIKAFILATQAIGTGNISDISFSASDFTSMDANQQGIILDSMIIRCKITPELEIAAGIHPTFSFNALDYEDGSVPTCLKKAAALAALDELALFL